MLARLPVKASSLLALLLRVRPTGVPPPSFVCARALQRDSNFRAGRSRSNEQRACSWHLSIPSGTYSLIPQDIDADIRPHTAAMSTSTANGVSAMEGIADASTSSSIGIETSAGQASTSTQQPPADDMTSRDYCAQQSTILRPWSCCVVLTLLLPCGFAPFRRGLVQVSRTAIPRPGSSSQSDICTLCLSHAATSVSHNPLAQFPCSFTAKLTRAAHGAHVPLQEFTRKCSRTKCGR